MTFNHFSIVLFPILLFGMGVSSSQAQSIGKRLTQQGYIQFSGLPYYLGDIKGENSNISGYHVQLAVGTTFNDTWGVGLGAGSWGIRDGGYRTTRYTVFGPHIRYFDERSVAHFEAGALIGYRFFCNGNSFTERLSLSQPFSSPFFRLQYGLRFLRRWIAGLSISYLPAIKSEGIRESYASSLNIDTSFITKKISIWGGQVFVGILLEGKPAKRD